MMTMSSGFPLEYLEFIQNAHPTCRIIILDTCWRVQFTFTGSLFSHHNAIAAANVPFTYITQNITVANGLSLGSVFPRAPHFPPLKTFLSRCHLNSVKNVSINQKSKFQLPENESHKSHWSYFGKMA